MESNIFITSNNRPSGKAGFSGEREGNKICVF